MRLDTDTNTGWILILILPIGNGICIWYLYQVNTRVKSYWGSVKKIVGLFNENTEISYSLSHFPLSQGLSPSQCVYPQIPILDCSSWTSKLKIPKLVYSIGGLTQINFEGWSLQKLHKLSSLTTILTKYHRMKMVTKKIKGCYKKCKILKYCPHIQI